MPDPSRIGDPPAAAREDSLAAVLRDLIAQDGPIPVARYMALALGHPTLGYYTTRDPFGAAGDFVTAPEISQMFGELLGIWAAEVWHGLGRPAPVRLVELGPGRGTLMADALRAARAMPGLREAIDIHLVETSPVLREAQRRALEGQGATATWHGDINGLPPGPAIVIANEFFDALPIRQFVWTERGWCERLVGLDGDRLAFGLAAEAQAGLSLSDSHSFVYDGMPHSGRREAPIRNRGAAWMPASAPVPGSASPPRNEDLPDMVEYGGGLMRAPLGTTFEVCPAGDAIMRTLAARVAGQGGALLVIDYGSAVPGWGDTLQAVRAHRFVDVLAEPGSADLTAHVGFASLARVAAAAGACVHGPVPQGRFLRQLGLDTRAVALKTRTTAAQAAAIDAAVARLAGPNPGMGDLFKVLAVTSADAPAPPGFAPEL